MEIDLEKIQILAASEFYTKVLDLENNDMLDTTAPCECMQQTVPSIYIINNSDFGILQDTNMPGILLTIVSTAKSIDFCYEIFDNPYIKYFNSNNHKIIPILKIARKDLISHQKLEKVNFIAVNPPKSYEIMKNVGHTAPGGIIGMALFKGFFKLSSKLEKSTIEKEGQIYTLQYNDGNKIKTIKIISELSIVNFLDDFLLKHWTANLPEKIKIEDDKGGCFIATACYGDYNHPNVLVLRQFRDNILTKSIIGRSFISFYYKHSPALANKIEKQNNLKSLIRLTLIYPLVLLTSKTKK